MKTTILKVDPTNPEAALIEQAAGVLRNGGLVAFPTETVYGLGANAIDPVAVAQIFTAKGRPATDPLIVHVASVAAIARIAEQIPTIAYTIGEHFWPGPLTLVLRRRSIIPDNVSAGLETVAVRVPSHPVAQALIQAADLPIAAPSANRFARPSPTTAQHVLDDLNGRFACLIDGGPTSIGVESTVLDLSSEPPVLLRPGGIALEALRQLLPDLQFTPRYHDTNTAASAPGGLVKHYAPEGQLFLILGPYAATLDYIAHEATRRHNQGQRVGILATNEDRQLLEGTPAIFMTLGSMHDLEGVARDLFAQIRAIDATGVDIILVRGLPQVGLGLAIWDRLVRAAEGRVVEV